LIAASDDEGVAALYNSATVDVIGAIMREDLATWAAETGMRATIEDESKDAQSPLRASALAILDVLRGAAIGINLSKPQNMALLDAWEGAGKLNPIDKASFIALAMTTTPRSIVQTGRLVTANDIARVVRDDLGNPLIGA